MIHTTINFIQCFYFRVPISAFGFDGSMIMEISVEYGLSKDKTNYLGNVWVRADQASVRHFLMPITVGVETKDVAQGLFEALQNSTEFSDAMVNYINHVMNH